MIIAGLAIVYAAWSRGPRVYGTKAISNPDVSTKAHRD
jgi:hypothetical protein